MTPRLYDLVRRLIATASPIVLTCFFTVQLSSDRPSTRSHAPVGAGGCGARLHRIHLRHRRAKPWAWRERCGRGRSSLLVHVSGSRREPGAPVSLCRGCRCKHERMPALRRLCSCAVTLRFDFARIVCGSGGAVQWAAVTPSQIRSWGTSADLVRFCCRPD